MSPKDGVYDMYMPTTVTSHTWQYLLNEKSNSAFICVVYATKSWPSIEKARFEWPKVGLGEDSMKIDKDSNSIKFQQITYLDSV